MQKYISGLFEKEPINWLIDWQIQKILNPEVCEGRMVNVHFIL